MSSPDCLSHLEVLVALARRPPGSLSCRRTRSVAHPHSSPATSDCHSPASIQMCAGVRGMWTKPGHGSRTV